MALHMDQTVHYVDLAYDKLDKDTAFESYGVRCALYNYYVYAMYMTRPVVVTIFMIVCARGTVIIQTVRCTAM